MTQWRSRYRGYGVLVYWHVETNAVCIYSQLRSFSFSEVAAMIEGLIRHDTEMRVEKNFVDSHGQSEVAFAFCNLLGGVRLMPRLKRIKYERLYLPNTGMAGAFPNLAGVLSRPVRWDLIAQQYDEMVKHTVALKTGTCASRKSKAVKLDRSTNQFDLISIGVRSSLRLANSEFGQSLRDFSREASPHEIKRSPLSSGPSSPAGDDGDATFETRSQPLRHALHLPSWLLRRRRARVSWLWSRRATGH